jgi:hypothetical protein
MDAYETVTDLLIHQGPGLQDFVTAGQLDQLIDGTLPPSVIVDQYMLEIEDSINLGSVSIASNETEMRTDLLDWVRAETLAAIDQRKHIARDDAMAAKLDEISALVQEEERAIAQAQESKLTLARQALDRGATKAAVAAALRISRPTLDKWLSEAR